MVKQNILVSCLQARFISYLNQRKRGQLNNDHVLNFRILDSHCWPLGGSLFMKTNHGELSQQIRLLWKKEKGFRLKQVVILKAACSLNIFSQSDSKLENHIRIFNIKLEVCVCSVMSDSATPWTVAVLPPQQRPPTPLPPPQAPLFMKFPKQEYWSRLPFPLPGIFLTQGLNSPLLYLLH